ncbi:AI-2E family transporter [Rivularia sp. UHCC 0363]|uniref:AI-2E family transporter n=1 Tax=Rivularia sp. UHCC 0363 TaxID=3110244 RepID=UPI002B20E97E|nr:AI-2E family transporter [Rivularia sp. UHCC 0363]MEA5596402.1 AI-2E family transporter [Rivularia sp. UHCC 0363]
MRRWASLKNLLVYGLSAPIIALNVGLLSFLFHYFRHPLTILSVAAILAFLLNYPVKFLERARISREWAVTIVLLVTLTLVILIGITLVPLAINQTIQLSDKIPDWLNSFQDQLEQLEAIAKKRRLPLINLKILANQTNASIENLLQQLPFGAVGFAATLISTLVNTALVIVLAFYMLLYGDRVWYGLLNLLPEKIRFPLSKSLLLNFHYFFLSQLLLALFMVASLTPIFLFIGIPFAFLFAVVIGLSQLIPFVGATLGIGLVTILLLLQNWWLATQLAFFSFLIQQVKDNLLAPKLQGKFTGLNPIWIFVAILMGFEIAGLLGTLVAIPIAGTIKGTFDALRKENSTQSVSITIDQEPSEL